MGNSVTVVLKALGFLPPPPQRSFQLRRHPHRLFQSQDPYPEVCFAIFNNLRTDVFINALKEILKDIPSLNSDYGSEIVSQSEFLPSNRHLDRAFVNLNLMTSLETYTPQMSPSLKNEADQHSSTQEKETTFTHKLEGIQASLLPSFTALLTDCCAEVCQGSGSAQSNLCEEVDLKSQIVRYMEDSSFQDMLIEVEKVISEIGGDLTLQLYMALQMKSGAECIFIHSPAMEVAYGI